MNNIKTVSVHVWNTVVKSTRDFCLNLPLTLNVSSPHLHPLFHLLPDAGSLSLWSLSGLLKSEQQETSVFQLIRHVAPITQWLPQEREYWQAWEEVHASGMNNLVWFVGRNLGEDTRRGRGNTTHLWNIKTTVSRCLRSSVCLRGLFVFRAQLLSEQLSSRCWYRAYPETLINS